MKYVGMIVSQNALVAFSVLCSVHCLSTKVAVGSPRASSALNGDTGGNAEVVSDTLGLDTLGPETITTASVAEYPDTFAEEDERAGETKPGFINSLPGHGSYFQVSLGNGSGVPNSSARRLSVRASTADGRVGHSFALHVARFDDDFAPAWGKPVAEYQISYVLPYDGPGLFFVRAGGAIPLGHDNPESALASAAAAVQSPNDAIFVLPSTVTARSSVSWLLANRYLVSQFDFGIDIGLFGYEPQIHPVLNANAALGIVHKGFMVAAEASTALPWTGALTDMIVTGGALYGTISDTKVGLFVGRQDEIFVVRGRVQYEY